MPVKPIAQQDLDLVLAETAPKWSEMRGQRILITGGTGFFGCWLVESFCHINRRLDLEATATILTRNPDAFAKKCPHLASDPAVSLHAGDVRSFSFPEGEHRYVIHAATESWAREGSQKPEDLLSTIVDGTERVLGLALAHGTRKFLLTSSGAVYGKQPADLSHVPEIYTPSPEMLDPNNAYAEGKRVSEQLCSKYNDREGLECKIARCWAFCGPHLPLDKHFAIGNFIGDALANRPIQITGDGTPRRSYLYAADLAIWLWTILFDAPSLVPFNVGSAHDVSILELAHTIAETLNPKVEIRVAKKADLGAAPERYIPSVERAQQMLGLREIIALEETIRRTAEWYKS